MISPRRPVRAVVVDPNANTPPYDRALCGALARLGCQVELMTAPFLYEELARPTGYRVRHAFFGLAGGRLGARLGLGRRPAARRLLKAAEYPLDWAVLVARLARRPPDVLHVQWSLDPALDVWCWRGLRRRGVPVVYTSHNLLPHDARRGDAGRYARLYRAVDAVIVHSRRSAGALVERFGPAPERVAVVPHGPLLEEEPDLDRAEARRRLGLPPSAPLILFAGLIEPYKGLGDLVVAFTGLADAWPAARLVVAGRPNEPFAPYRAALEARGLLDRTHLDLRFLPRADLAAYLCAADVVALPYRHVTTSGVLLAARRFGRPVVATAVGDLAELIQDGENGLLVPPADPPALADALSRLLADPALGARFGAAGRRVALTEHGWDQIARRTLLVYRSVMTARPLAPRPPSPDPGRGG
jgi:glycosyltransferase involved in cell wall biosynthesis